MRVPYAVSKGSRPVIGVCAAWEKVLWSFWDQDASLVPATYSDAVRLAGGIPVGLLPATTTTTDVECLLERIDGLLLIGGSDLDPSTYGIEKSERTERTVPMRDDFEIALARAALERGVPTLGICRGLQILNVASGGTLHQHLDDVGFLNHRAAPGRLDAPSNHRIAITVGSLMATAANSLDEVVNSHHHQGVAQVGHNGTVTARSVPDGVVEAVEWGDHPFALGVQWHPEALELSRTIGTFVSAASARQAQHTSNETNVPQV